MPYQLECPICLSASSFQLKADPLQAYIRGVLPHPFAQRFLSDSPTPKQRGAAAWDLAISACLRREMAAHLRCESCNILMGPGHIEGGIGPWCGTHGEVVPALPVAVSPTETGPLAWIARGGQEQIRAEGPRLAPDTTPPG